MVKILTAAAFFVSLTALATTQVAADLPTLSREADAIVQGRVLSTRARLTMDGRRIVTDTTVAVVDSLKGSLKGEVVVMQPGGEVGDLGQRVEGAATFAVGEEVVLFLERKSDTRFGVLGMSQGKFRLERSPDGKVTFALPAAERSGLLLDPRTRQPVQTPLVTLELSQLKTQILASLRAGPAVQTPRP